MKVARTVGIAAAALFCECAALRAECLVPPPPCEALKQVSLVALVDVLEGNQHTQVPNRPGEYFMRPDVRVRVLERFKGVQPEQHELVGKIPFNAETILLSAGKTYLLYSFVDSAGNWDTSCTRTRVADAADEEVRVLRQCK